LTSVTDPNGHANTYSYDPATGDLAASKDPNNQPIQTLTYSSGGRLASVANGSSPPSLLTQQVAQQQETILDPNGKLSTTLIHDDLGDVTEKDQTFNSRTVRTTAQFDSAGRMTKYVDELGTTESWNYDESSTASNGNLLSYTDGAQNTWQYTNYDSFGHATTLLGPDGSILFTLKYDPVTGLLVSEAQPGLPATTFTYYPNGLRKTTTDPTGRSVTDAYNSAGYKTSITDSAGHAVILTPDGAGRDTMVQDQSGNLTHYAYDGLGNVTSITDPTATTLSYHYNVRNQIDQVSDPVQSITYLYNDLGLVQQRTDRNGAVTAYTYDTHSRLVREVRPGNDVSNYQYDPRELLVEADNLDGQVMFTYSDAGRVQTQVTCAPQPNSASCTPSTPTATEPTVQLTYAYGGDGYPTGVTGPDGATTFHYDGAARLDSVTDPAGRAFLNHYDGARRLTSVTLPNGVTDNFTYNSANDLIARDATTSSSVLSKAEYAINPVTGLRDTVTDLDGTSSFTYGANGWLQTASHPAGSGLASEAITYDAAGNRTSWPGAAAASVSYNSLKQLVSDGRFSYAYDGEGNLVSKSQVLGGSTTRYRWNADHQLVEIDYPSGTVSRYRYDPVGRRIESNDAGSIIRYVWDAYTVHNEYDGTNSLTASYTTLPTGALAADATNPSEALEVSRAGTPTYYLHDGARSTIATTDAAGSVTARYRYDTSGNPAATNGPETRYSFAGAQFDSTSGLYYMRDRYYDPGTGRFISEDPAVLHSIHGSLGRWTHVDPSADLTNPVTSNLYAYALNDAVYFTDPSGDGLLSAGLAKGLAIVGCSLVLGSVSGLAPAEAQSALDKCADFVQAVGDDMEKRYEMRLAMEEAAAAAEEEPALAETEQGLVRLRIVIIEIEGLEG
jgi:RHS repeat-associated protein